MTQDIILFPSEREETNWYISFLKEKEKKLISELGYKRIKTQKKLFYCEHGKFCYPFIYVRMPNGKSFSPLRDCLGIYKNNKMSQDFKNKLVMKASRTTYQKAVEDISDSFGFKLGKRTLNRYVIDEGNKVQPCGHPQDSQNILLGDSTKVRNGKGGHHEVMGLMSLDYAGNSSSLTAFDVNEKPKEIAKRIDFSLYEVFVGDADLGLRNFFKEKLPFQLCHRHVITDVSFFLWKGGMGKKVREYFVRKLESILYTLQNSTKKYWKTNNTGRLVNRIIRTKKNLRSLAAEISTQEKHDAARYIMDHIDNMTTAANLALVGIKVPWTTNHAERLMQEIGVRTKKKGMNWTERGLKAILHIVLRRYFLPKERRNYIEVFANIQEKVVET
jgi:hypothetical protein